MPADFLHERWSAMPGAGVCIAHGAVAAVDIDVDDRDIIAAILAECGPVIAARRGARGQMVYYRPHPSHADLGARVRWYRGPEAVFDLMFRGSQSVLPPTIHPVTGEPYRWLTPESLEDLDPAELPELPPDILDRLDRALLPLGVKREAPRRVSDREYERPAATGHDLEKPFGRSVNDRALEAEALDRWFPALGLAKTRQRGPGAWEAVAHWRPSNSGKPISERNPNLKVVRSGIVDFGADRSYTPIDLVMCARDCSFDAAIEWLKPYLRPEAIGTEIALAPPAPPPAPLAPAALRGWSAVPIFRHDRPAVAIRPARVPTEAEFEALIPPEPPEFPIRNPGAAIPGILGEAAAWLDAASPKATEAGGLAVALPLLGAIMGRAYATPSNLRTNIYTVALGASGSGKTSLVAPAKELLSVLCLRAVLGPDRVASGSGLIRVLASGPRRVFFLDEFGHMLQQLGSAGAGIHARQIITEFTSLYSAAGTIYTGTAYATREPDPIDCPHLCLFGMATPEQFWRAFGSASLEDGSVARYIVMPLGRGEMKDPNRAFEAELCDGIRGVLAAIASRVTGKLGRAEVCTAPLTEGADAERVALGETMEACAEYADANAVRGAAPILRRVRENALKIALVSAVGRNPLAPVIDASDFAIGHAIARWSATVMIANIRSHIADNQIERDINDVERFVRSAGEGGRTWRDVQRAFRRVRARDLREIMEALEAQGSVRCIMTPSQMGGHPQKTFFGT